MLVMALDVGTSGARARAFDPTGRALPDAVGHVAYEPRTTPDGGVELDAENCCARWRRQSTAVSPAAGRARARSPRWAPPSSGTASWRSTGRVAR
jgi:glycerol kinase